LADRVAVDLTNCDREPIHIPGSIQPHGFLLACDASLDVVQRHSANAEQYLGIPVVPQCKLESLIGPDALHDVRNALATSNDPAKPGLLMGLPVGDEGRRFDISVHRHLGSTIIEFEPLSASGSQSSLDLARILVTRLRRFGNEDELLQNAARLVQALLGYDRVMVYRFAPDGSGHVVSEAKRPDLETFLGLHYPASDIPRQARALYVKNTIRIISDANAARVLIEPELDAQGEALDLSYAHLRSVSPIHCEYLRNMGVAASMSVSILVDGELWGLIACHHYSARTLSSVERMAAEMFGEFFSVHIEALEHKRKLEAARYGRASLDALLRRVASEPDALQTLRDNIEDLQQLMPCDGVGLWIDGIWRGHGATPPAEAIPELVGHLSSVVHGQVWATNALCDAMPAAEPYCRDAAGVLAIALSQAPRDYALFFRKEVTQTVNWAGNPEKMYETGPHGDRLTPRKSFALWKESVERQALPWNESDLEIAETSRIALLEIVLRHSELLEEERRKAAARQRTLNRELNHRVKNILALIQSLVAQPRNHGDSVEDYVGALKGRIHSLAQAHDQVIRGGGSLSELLNAELRPYKDLDVEVRMQGPPAGLKDRAYSVVALVVHELSTNAAKYGALSVSGGSVDISWEITDAGECELKWKERGGPVVHPPTRHGFGSVLLERNVAFDLGGESQVAYESAGVVARFLIPAAFVTPVEREADRDSGGAIEPGVISDSFDRPLAQLKVLVVEDQYIVALDVETMLLDEGAEAVELAPTAQEALRLLQISSPDVAVLDVNLGTDTSIAVAEELSRRGIPFIFATGYGDSHAVPETLLRVPRVQKPYNAAAISLALRQVLQAGARPS
jgi:light-regulated signal transduction histidine kinase (bacteriophytochrome)/CheY-like chemotaxis protein